MTTLVYVVPGWSEDKWHISRLAKAFGRNKLSLTDNLAKADIVVAHSSGCYSLPKSMKPRLVLLIGPPFHPHAPLLARIFRNVIKDIPRQFQEWGVRFWLMIRLHNFIYALIHPKRHIKLWRSTRRTLTIAAHSHKAIVIRNKDDSYCSPELGKHAQQFKNVVYLEMDGLHEDCWFNPKPYVDLILKEL